LSAAVSGSSEIALGNVIGSNICNIALILGIAALIRPIKINLRLIKTDILIMIAVSLLLIVLLLDGGLDWYDGVIFLTGIIFYNIMSIYLSKKVVNKQAKENYEEEIVENPRKVWIDMLLIIGGMGVLVFGASLFLEGAVKIAALLGASKALIGLSVVAFGTSLPELATSIVAGIKDKGDISIGNAIGSNIFNILLILGATAFVAPIYSNNIDWVDMAVMVFVAGILFPLAWTKFVLSRMEGLVLLLIYGGYLYYLYTKLPMA
jgi:cation:H+ antiporter